jgi:REP element-mobilizing transposase RayT
MPRRPAIDPHGTYHVGSRGTYGRTLFHTADEHELFLTMYAGVARKHAWSTLSWALMKNHHHFVIALTRGGLSEGMRELHGGYSRRIHAHYGQTRKGHLFRHAFFARELVGERAVLGSCAYVDLNPSAHRLRFTPRRSDWCGCAATLGRTKRRAFHTPEALLRLLDPDLSRARMAYQDLLIRLHAERQLERSPNDGVGTARRVRRD